ncbi:ATP-binding protein [Fusibacter bizertensis]
MHLNKGQRIIAVIICFVLVIFLLGLNIGKFNQDTYIDSGKIFLTDDVLHQREWISLKGEWEFYWRTFDPVLDGKSPVLVNVPSVWNGTVIDGSAIGGDGYATYRLNVTIEHIGEPLAMRVENFSSAYKCFVDGKLVAENGVISKDEKGEVAEYKPKIIRFTPDKETFDIVFQVSNYTYARGGFWYDVCLGEEEHIEKLNGAILFKDAMIIGTLLIMSIYFLSDLFLMKKASNGLYFFIMCLLLILRTSLYGDYLLVKVFPELPFKAIIFLTYLTIIWFPITMVQMLRNLFELTNNKQVFAITMVYGIVSTIITIVLPIKTYTGLIYLFELISFILVFYAISKVFYGYVTNTFDSLVPLLGAMLIFAAGFHDVLYQANVITNTLGEWTSVSLVFFMYMLTYVFNKRYSEVYSSAIEYSEKLKVSLNEQYALTDELYKLDKIKDQFLTNTSHELRTPLNGIINISDALLRGQGGQLSESQSYSIEVMKTSANRLYRLINDILDASLIRENKITFNNKVFDVHMVLKDCLFSLGLTKKNDNVVLINEVQPKQFYLKTDEERLKQIIFNIVGNALKFTIQGEVRVYARIEKKCFCLKVKDTGIGISHQDIDKIYDVFTQIDNASNRFQEGAGLGLYIAREVAKFMGAEIEVKSIMGLGSTFSINFPLSMVSDEEHAIMEGLVTTNSNVNSSHPINGVYDVYEAQNRDKFSGLALVVDDDFANRVAIKQHLELIGIETIEASNGYEALASIEEGSKFDLVLLDVMMPGLSGFEVLKSIREKYSQIELPVIMLTARINPNDIEYSMSLGANDYISKPYDVNELFARVNNIQNYASAYKKYLDMELSFLQAQIKPHFIFNALSTISSLSIKEPKLAKEMILDMADYLRLSFDFDNHAGLSNLGRELDLVKAYTAIEKIRFGNRLNIVMEIAEDIDCTLPILCIQPLVENAIMHGVLKSENEGEVRLYIGWVENYIRISVSDTGIGISQEVIDSVLSQKTTVGHVGLNNIHIRLKKLYGSGLNFTQSDAYHTIIYFDVPYISKEVMNESLAR